MQLKIRHNARGMNGKWFVLKAEYREDFATIEAAIEWAKTALDGLQGHYITIMAHVAHGCRYWTAAEVFDSGRVATHYEKQWPLCR